MNDQALAQALQCADFAAAQYCAEEYVRSVHAALDVTSDRDLRAAIYQETIKTLQNHLHLARVLRAHLATQIQNNAGSCLYTQSEIEAGCHRWQFEG
jgi:hypothetical protein